MSETLQQNNWMCKTTLCENLKELYRNTLTVMNTILLVIEDVEGQKQYKNIEKKLPEKNIIQEKCN